MAEIRRLAPEDDRSSFTCGDAALDAHFRERVGQQQFKQRTSVTYVYAETGVIIGFATVVGGSVRREELSEQTRKLPPSALPVVVLARMGVVSSQQARGVGAQLLGRILQVALSQASECGCVGIIVDAKPTAAGFYEKHDFRWLDPIDGAATRRGFLSIHTIEAVLRD